MKSFRKTCKAFSFWSLLCESTFSTLSYFTPEKTALLKSSWLRFRIVWLDTNYTKMYTRLLNVLISVVRKRFSFPQTFNHQDAALQYQPNSGVARIAIIFFVTKDTSSCSATRCHRIETLLVTICLQRCLLTNQLFPLVTTQWRRAVYSVSNQGVWRSNTLRDRSSWRGRSWRMVSSSRKAILKMVKQGLSCLKIEVIFVGLQPRIVVKSSLNIEKKWIYDKTSESIVNLPWKFLSGLFPKRSSRKVSL